MEIRVKFCLNGKEYQLFVEKASRKTKVYLFEQLEGSRFLMPLSVETSTSTLREDIEFKVRELRFWLRSRKKGVNHELHTGN